MKISKIYINSKIKMKKNDKKTKQNKNQLKLAQS